MLTVSINGKPFEFKKTISLIDVIGQNNPSNNSVAVAVNGEFVPRSNYAAIKLHDGDLIDIVSPVGGG